MLVLQFWRVLIETSTVIEPVFMTYVFCDWTWIVCCLEYLKLTFWPWSLGGFHSDDHRVESTQLHFNTGYFWPANNESNRSNTTLIDLWRWYHHGIWRLNHLTSRIRALSNALASWAFERRPLLGPRGLFLSSMSWTLGQQKLVEATCAQTMEHPMTAPGLSLLTSTSSVSSMSTHVCFFWKGRDLSLEE